MIIYIILEDAFGDGNFYRGVATTKENAEKLADDIRKKYDTWLQPPEVFIVEENVKDNA